MKFGYRRVSSIDQKLDRQQLPDDLDQVYDEKVSGASTKDRPQLEDLLSRLREGDEVYVYSTDRLARSTRDLLDIVERVKDAGATIHFQKENLKFSGQGSDPMNDFMLTMLGALAQMERENIRARQLEGIEIAKRKGVYKGTKPRLDRTKVWRLLDADFGPEEVAKTMGISRASVFRIKKEGRPADAAQMDIEDYKLKDS